MIAQFLKIEYLNNPIGIDIERPRFSGNALLGKNKQHIAL